MAEGAFVLWIYVVIIEAVVLSYIFLYFPNFALIVLFSQLWVFLKGFGTKRTILLFLIFSMIFVYSYSVHLRKTSSLIEKVDNAVFEGIINDLPKKGVHKWRQGLSLRNPKIGLDTEIILDKPLPPGTLIKGVGFLKMKQKRYNPGSLPYTPKIIIIPKSFSARFSNHIRYLPQMLRWRLLEHFYRSFPEDVAEVLSAVVIGHSPKKGLYSAYSKVGVSHLLSISGTHFGLFAFLVFSSVFWLARLMPLKWLIRISSFISLKEFAAVLTFPPLCFYLMLSGGRIPAMRAFIMTMLFLMGLLLGRKRQWLYAVLFAAVVILLVDPQALFSPSFQLSFMAVLFIGLTITKTEPFIKRHRNRMIQIFLRLFFITSGAFLGLMPLIGYWFHHLSIFAIPFNMLITPLVCFVILPVALLSSIVFLIAGEFPFSGILTAMISFVNTTVVTASEASVAWVPVRGFSPLVVISLYLSVLMLVLRKKLFSGVSFTIGVLLVLSSLVFDRAYSGMVTFLDVGQGDAAVVEDRRNTIVLDTGPTGIELVSYLRYRGIKQVDALLLSHAGMDHSGGLWRVLKEFKVKEVWDNGLIIYKPRLPEGVKERRLKAGVVLQKDDISLLVLHPPEGYYTLRGDENNNNSLVVKVEKAPLSVLFTGDIERDAEESLLRLKGYLRSRVLKIPHHGSRTSSSERFLKAVSPEVVVISVGAGNLYGHPHRNVLERLKGYKVLRTDIDGAVRIMVYKDGTTVVKRYKEFILEGVPFGDIRGELRNLYRILVVW